MNSWPERGTIDYKQTKMLPCACGGLMNNISLGYGRTPYGIFCPSCKSTFLNKITNCCVDGAVRAWNKFRLGEGNPFEIKESKWKV